MILLCDIKNQIDTFAKEYTQILIKILTPMAVKNFGILASIDWNSNDWKEQPSEDDLSNSNFGYDVDHGITPSALNFAHENYPTDEKGYYFGLLPQLWTKMPDKEKARYIEVVFIKAHKWEDKQNYIIGFYAFPTFVKCKRPSPIETIEMDFELNVKSLPKDIHLLENHINLSTSLDLQKFLPKGKEPAKQVYNYLTKENVFKILDKMTEANPKDKKLSGVKYRLITTIERMI